MVSPRMSAGRIVGKTARGISAHANARHSTAEAVAGAGLGLALEPWTYRAACVDVDPELFFSFDGESRRDLNRRQAEAKAVCARCPVAAACLKWADDHNERGIWGGTTRQERVGRRNVKNGASGKPRRSPGSPQKRPVRPAGARTARSATPVPPGGTEGAQGARGAVVAGGLS